MFKALRPLPSLEPLHIGGRVLAIHLKHRKGTKRIQARLSPQSDALIVSTGIYTSISKIHSFLEMAKPWIEKTLEKRPIPCALTPGMTLTLAGKEVFLEHTEAERIGITYEKSILRTHGPKSHFPNLVKRGLKQIAHEELSFHSKYLAQDLGVEIKKITVKDMKSRWGSCSTKGNLNYNWRIIFAPQPIMVYLCAHEIAHLKHMNHSQDFWEAVEGICPEYRQARLWLKKNGASLFVYG